jgi:RHS repeat-associated protein
MSVVDNSNNTSGFKDGNTTGDDYVYDGNGNMTVDKNKNITGIVYNHLNLPTKIIFPTGNIVYFYNASGQKVQKVVTENTTVTTTDYLGGYQYKNSVLQFFPTAEGYVKSTPVSGTNTYSYVFNYTDHLGNVRLSYTKDATTGSLKILEENNYYPFGLKHNSYNVDNFQPEYKYKFIGREWQDELGLNMYDLRARQYDPAIARFVAVDPLTDEDEQLDKSNYAYAWNDPIKYNDPDGECPWCVGAILGAVVEIGSQAASNYVNGKDVTDISWGQVGVAAVEGALTSGASVGRTLAVKAGAALASSAIDYANDGNKIRSVKDGFNIVKNAAINVALDKVAGGVSKFALGKIGEKALAKAGDKAILSNNTANKIVKAVTGTSNRTADAIAKKVDVVGGSKVVSKAIKESVNTAGTVAAKAAANKKVEDVKKSTSF